MDFSKFNDSRLRRTIGCFAIAGILLLLFSMFVDEPEVQAVTHAVMQKIAVVDEPSPSLEAGAGLNLMLIDPAFPQGQPISMPFLEARSADNTLVRFVYSVILDEKTLGAHQAPLDLDALKLENKYGLLFTQVINGGDFYLNGHWVAGLPQSTQEQRQMWFEPFVVPLPSRLLKADGTPNVVTVSQTTHEPYISVPRLYFGEVNELRRIYDVAYFFSATSVDVAEMLSLIAGLFLLGMWVVAPRERLYAIAGGISILWAFAFMFFQLQQSSADVPGLWHWAVSACAGGLLYLHIIFIFLFVGQPLRKKAHFALVCLAITPAVAYALAGSATEHYVDLLWWPAVIVLHCYATLGLVGYWRKTRRTLVGVFSLQSMLFVVLASYDQLVRLRLIENLGGLGLAAGWHGLLFEGIHLLHLGMLAFLMVVGYMVVVKHRGNVTELENCHLLAQQREVELVEIHSKRELISRSEAKVLERERIYQDIHDGIGSQLVKAIFSLRSAGSDSSAVVDNLQACLRDLRLVIDAEPESDVDIQTTVFAFCVTQEVHLEGSKLALRYDVGFESTVYADAKVTLNVLRVLQESLSNTMKHSSATFIDINLKLSKSHLNLSITDNGGGDRRSAQQILDQQSAYGASGNRGITGLALRAADIGAKYTIDITKSGTKVCLSIPLPSVVTTKAEERSAQTAS